MECFLFKSVRPSHSIDLIYLYNGNPSFPDLYYLAFPKDRVGTKAIVYGTYMLESTQTFLFSASAFQVFATNFGSAEILDQVHTFWFAAPMLTGIGTVLSLFISFYELKLSALKWPSLRSHFMRIESAFCLGESTSLVRSCWYA